MRIILIFLFSFLFLNTLCAQQPTWNRESKIDTLNMSISFSDSIDTNLQEKFKITFKQSLIDFNKTEDKQFIVLFDESKQKDFVHVNVGEIKYVTTGRSIWVTFLDLGLLVADIALLNVGWPPFFLPILTPAVRSKVHLEMSESIVHPKNKIDKLSNPSGYFVGIEKQNERFDKKIGKNVNRFLRKLNKQQSKNEERN